MTKIIHYLVIADVDGRTLNQISYHTEISYQVVRKIVKVHFPHCFVEKPPVGWYITNEPPVLGIAFDFNPPRPAPVETQVVQEKFHERKGRWVWDQTALRTLDHLFGMPFVKFLEQAQQQNSLQEIATLGKTMARAADQMIKTGRIPFND